MSWIILECICTFALAGLLISSGGHATNDSNESSSTEFSNFINTTIYTTEDTSNLNSSDSNSSNNLNTSASDIGFSVSSEPSTESTTNVIGSKVSGGIPYQLATDVATKSVLNTDSSQEENSSKSKDYLESQSVKRLDLGNDAENSTGYDSHFSTESISETLEKMLQSGMINTTHSDKSAEKSEVSSQQNSSFDSNEMAISETMTLATKLKEIDETTTGASMDSSQAAKFTVIKSTKKRSIDDKSSDISTTTGIFNETGDKSTHSATESSKIVTSDEVKDNDEKPVEHETSSSETSTGDVTTTDESYEHGNITIAEGVTSESSYGAGSAMGSLNESKLDLSSKDARATRKRRLSTLKHEKNITIPSPTSSMPPEEETDTVMDGSSNFDFPEHLSVSDAEVGPDSLPPESEWTAFSSHSSSSESVIKESNILSDAYKVNNREYMDRIEDSPPSLPSALSEPLIIATHPRESSTEHLNDHNLDLQTLSSIEVTSDLPSDHVGLHQDSSQHSISTRSTDSEDNLSSITTISYDDKETGLVNSDKAIPRKANTQGTNPKEISSIAVTSVQDVESSESSSSASNNSDSDLISVLSSALRLGPVLNPPVVAEEATNVTDHTLSSEDATSINLETVVGTEAMTQDLKMVSIAVDSSSNGEYNVESASPNNTSEHDERSVTENMDNSTLNIMKDAIINQVHPADISTSMTSQTTPTDKATPDAKLKDIMLGDSPHLIELALNVENISSTVLVKSDSDKPITDENKQELSLQPQAKKFVIRPVKIKVVSNESSQVGDISSNKIVRPEAPTDVLLAEAVNASLPQTLSPEFQSSEFESSSTTPALVDETNTSTPTEKNESVVENLVANKTGSGVIEDGNSTNVITGSPPIKTTTYRTGILKPRPRIPGSNPDSPRTRKPILSTHRPKVTTSGDPVAVFNKKKTRAGSITSSTTQRPTSSYSVQRIHFANRVPDSMIPLGPGISIDVTLPATTTTEAPTTTEEPYSEEPFTEPTQVPSLSSEDDVTLVKMAGTVVVKKGIRWNDQLYHRNSPQYKKIATQMHLRLERLFRSSPIATRVWSIEIDGFSEKLPMTGSVIVDFIISLVKYADHGEFFGIENMSGEEREEKRLASIFNGKLKNNTFGRYTVDPIMTEFKVLEEERRNKPTEAPGPEPPIPQWAIAVIVVGAASLIFILLFATVTMYGRHHMRRRYSNKLSEEDIDRSGDWESKMAAAYENLAADTIYDAEDGSIESMKRSYLVE